MRLVLSNRYCERKHWRWVSNLNWCRYCEAEDAWGRAAQRLGYTGAHLALQAVVLEARTGEELIAELKHNQFKMVTDA